MSEILSATLPGAIDPIPKDIWSCKVGTWRGDLLEHLPQVETSMLQHVWRRNTNLLVMGPQCKPPNEQFLHYFMREPERHVSRETDAVLQSLHPGRTQCHAAENVAPADDNSHFYTQRANLRDLVDNALDRDPVDPERIIAHERLARQFEEYALVFGSFHRLSA